MIVGGGDAGACFCHFPPESGPSLIHPAQPFGFRPNPAVRIAIDQHRKQTFVGDVATLVQGDKTSSAAMHALPKISLIAILDNRENQVFTVLVYDEVGAIIYAATPTKVDARLYNAFK